MKEKVYIDDAKAGNGESFSFLFNTYYKMTYNFIRSNIKNETESEDLTMLSFEKAFKSMRPNMPQNEFKSWLFAIAKNLCTDYYRMKERKREFDLENCKWHESTWLNPEELLIDKQSVENIDKAIHNLPFDLRQVIELRDQDMMCKEISDKLNVSINTVVGRIRYARKYINQSLKINSMKKILFLLIPFIAGCSCHLLPAQVPPQTIQLDVNCSAVIPDYTNMFTIKGGCSGVTPSQIPAVGTRLTMSNQPATITIKATGGNGKSSQVNFLLYGIDAVIPTITLKPEYITERVDQINKIYDIADRMLIDFDSIYKSKILYSASFDSAGTRHRIIYPVDSLEFSIVSLNIN